jgi:hypothetical protein
LWAAQNGALNSGQGITRDINTAGVYVLTDAFPPLGARVQMDILLPRLKDSGLGMRLNGEGVVIRVESRGVNNEAGFAAEVQFYPESSEMFLSHLKCAGQVV